MIFSRRGFLQLAAGMVALAAFAPIASAQWSLSGVKRTCLYALQMSAFDPKRTSTATSKLPV
jgi:hypothetical protein